MIVGLDPAPLPTDYLSPYHVRYRTSAAEREAGLDTWPWNDASAQARIPGADWYTADTLTRWNSWGPRARIFPAPVVALEARPARERVLAVASALLGLDYQHHHIPAWAPPPGWIWKPVPSQRRGTGLDCSNFVAFVYSYALGVSLPTNIAYQSEAHLGRHSTGPTPQLVSFTGYDDALARLAPGDVLFNRSSAGDVTHCVLWLGENGGGPDDTALVLDSSRRPRRDATGNIIPAGVQIRPFARTGSYALSASHAHRIVPGRQ